MPAITLASLAALPHAGAPAPRAPQCPAVAVSCPDTAGGGQPVTFAASVENAPADLKPAYNWVVSAGTISSGQGTAYVTVDTTGVTSVGVTATVEVKGLPGSCPGSASCTTLVNTRGIYHDKLDEYGNIRFGDEKARLDNFAVELQNWPEGVGYIVGYGGRRSRRGEAARRIARAKRYLVTARAIPPGRVVTIDGGYRDDLAVELRMRRKGAPPPAPAPTVDPSEVVFINRAPKRRPRRNRLR